MKIKEKLKKICMNCKHVYLVEYWRLTITKFCSKKCWYEYWKVNGRSKEICNKISYTLKQKFKNYEIKPSWKGKKLPLKVKEKISALPDVFALREWLIENVKGMDYKEASHFLRNVGFGDDIAILDRHILKNLVRYSIIDEVPKSLTGKKYLEIEEKMRKFAQKAGIPFAHLDLLWWSEETGEIFK